MNPELFGPYRIEGLLGRGGMGEVYRAFDTGHDRVVALKCLLPHLAADALYVARFRRESALAARLREPHVIPIHRYGEIDGRLFLDMRLVEGDDLGAVLRTGGPLGLTAAVNVIGQVAAALEAAHDDGLVHRDVKPSNVLVATSQSLGETAFVYLADFGIARHAGVEGGVTAAGALIGSADYLAPERLDGTGTVDHRSDIYALGCLLFECLTGRKPFPATAPAAVLLAHLQQAPPAPSAARAGVPRTFDEVVARAMAKNPADRYASVADLAHAARAALVAASPAPAPGGWWTRVPSAEPPRPVPNSFDWRATARAQAPSPQPPPASSGSPAAARTPAPSPQPPSASFDWRATARPAVAPPSAPAPSGPAGAWWERRATAVHQVAETITIGRAPECAVVLADMLVSRHHAELRQVGGQWRLIDLGSWNGTYVNGKRITTAAIGADDVIGIGHALFRLSGSTLVEYTDDGDIGFAANDLVVTRSGRRLLDGVSFTLPQRCVLAVIGPSGAGKSTLLGALTGQRPADSGHVHYAGRDLYESYDELRERIGLVPQDDILHPQLTVRRALRYAAELRFPADTPAVDRERRVEEVLAELGLSGHADQRISTLSGGQRKRTSVALELLTRPSLLLLDEPTSGLDPGMDKSVMQTLRALADGGRTIIVVTHSPAQLGLCDRVLVLARGGTPAYFGPPGEALAYFGQADFADMFLLLDQSEDVDWAERFRKSPEHARYLTPAAPGPATGTTRRPPDQRPRQQPAWRQFAVLCRRYLAVIAADRAYALFLLGLPAVLSVFAKMMPGDSGLTWPPTGDPPEGDPRQLLLLLVLGCAFMGFATSFREVVKERAILRRERAVGLSPGAYLGSKLVVLGLIGTVQAVVLGVLGTLNTPQPADPVVLGGGTAEIIVALTAVTVSIMALGLLVSALITNADRGMPILVVVLLLQLVLCGSLFPVEGRAVVEQLSWLMPARWGYAMGVNTGGLPGADVDPLWEHDSAPWLLGLGVQLALTVAFAAAARFALRARRPTRR